jgi:hypothetical protein
MCIYPLNKDLHIYIYILKPNIKVIIIVIAKVGGIENPFSLHHIYCLFSI